MIIFLVAIASVFSPTVLSNTVVGAGKRTECLDIRIHGDSTRQVLFIVSNAVDDDDDDEEDAVMAAAEATTTVSNDRNDDDELVGFFFLAVDVGE